jgi:hypothetical protein
MYKILVVKPEGKRALTRYKHRWENNTRNRMGRCGLDASGSGYGPVWGPLCEQGNEPSNSISLARKVAINSSRKTLLHGIS